MSTVNDIIRRSYLLLGLVGENIELTGFQAEEGLNLLNVILDSFGTAGFDIPYYTEFSFTMVVDQAVYKVLPEASSSASNEIENNKMVELVTVQVETSGLIYPVRISDINSIDYVVANATGSGRPDEVALTRWLNDGTTSAPYSRLKFMPSPSQAYTCHVRAKSYLDSVTLDQEFNFMPPSMQLFLSYELASHLLQYYESANWTPQKEAKYQEMKQRYNQGGDLDLTIQNSTILVYRNGYYSRDLLG